MTGDALKCNNAIFPTSFPGSLFSASLVGRKLGREERSWERGCYFSYISRVEEYGKRILATRPMREQLLANLHVLQRSLRLAKSYRMGGGGAITVPYGAVIMTDDTHSGK